MPCSTCLDPVPAACIQVTPPVAPYTHLSGDSLADLLGSTDAQLHSLVTALSTELLLRRTYSVTDVSTLPKLLQALIDKTASHDTSITTLNGKQTPVSLLQTPVAIGAGCLSSTPSGGTSQTVEHLLQLLVNKVCNLQEEVNALKAGQAPGTQLYVPHY